MKRLAWLVVLALAVRCAASDPTTPRMEKRKPQGDGTGWVIPLDALAPPPPPRFLDDQLVRAVLLPVGTYTQRVAERIRYHKMMLENGGQARHRGPHWPLLD